MAAKYFFVMVSISHNSDVLEIYGFNAAYLKIVFNYITSHSKYLHIGLLTAITIGYNHTAIGVAVNNANTVAYIL